MIDTFPNLSTINNSERSSHLGQKKNTENKFHCRRLKKKSIVFSFPGVYIAISRWTKLWASLKVMPRWWYLAGGSSKAKPFKIVFAFAQTPLAEWSDTTLAEQTNHIYSNVATDEPETWRDIYRYRICDSA